MGNLRRQRCAISANSDQGAVLIVVVGMFAMTLLLLFVSANYALQGMEPSRNDQDAKTALAAAQAGIDDYVARLAANESYWMNGGVDGANTAFSAGRLVSSTGSGSGSFRYSVLSTVPEITRDGVIRLQSTGMAGTRKPVSRKLTATLSPGSYLRYVYFTDLEVMDPVLSGDSWNSTCYKYYYSGRSGTTACAEIQWAGNDVVDGPLHTNDAMQIAGPALFTSPDTESSWPTGSTPAPSASKLWWGSGTPSSGTSARKGYLPVYAAALPIPASNSAILSYADPALSTGLNGCLYSGETRIIFTGSSMKVLSPGTTSAPSRCYDTSSSSSRRTEQTKSIPQVIYVKTAPNCGSVGVGYPQNNEDTNEGVTTDYDCHHGTAFVEGSVQSRVTVATDDDIVVTDDLTLTNGIESGTDVVGLIAQNNVWVYHPVDDDRRNLLSSSETVHRIDAAVLALNHSFVVQNWNLGNPLSSADTATKLTINGALAQKFRGPVGTGSGSSVGSGYLKNYNFDERLLVMQPPYFLQPTAKVWGVIQVTDG